MIRHKFSTILDTPIREGAWISYINSLDRDGKFDKLTMSKLIFAIAEEFELMEKTIEALKATSTTVTAASTLPIEVNHAATTTKGRKPQTCL